LATFNPGVSSSELNSEPDDWDEAILLALNEQPLASAPNYHDLLPYQESQFIGV
jgi:hypothetical protein